MKKDGTRPTLGHYVCATLGGALLLGLAELALLADVSSTALGLSSFLLAFVPTVFGMYFPYLGGALLLWSALAWGYFQIRGRWPRPRLVAASVAALVSSPYALYVASYTFSGPQVRELAYQPALVALACALLLGGIFGLAWLFVFRLVERKKAWWMAGGTAIFFLLTAYFNHTILPEEYPVLHTLLSGATLMVGSFCALEVSRSFAPALSRARTWGLVTLLLMGAIASRISLSRNEAFAWLLWGEGSTARHLQSGSEDEYDGPEGGESVAPDENRRLEKPVIADPKTEKTARLRRLLKPAPHIVVFSIDNVQADRVGAYGYKGNPSTPNIDRIAEGGVVFRNAYSLFPGTRIFMSSMLTGRRLPDFAAHHMPSRFQETSLTRLLKKRGYDVIVKGVFELTAQRDFDPTDYAIDTNLIRATPEQIRKSRTIPHIPYEERFKQITAQLKASHEADRPVFMWLHMLKPHRFRGKFVGAKEFGFGNTLDGLYDSSIAEADALIPKLEALMDQELGGSREVVWVIMSDHGAGLTRGDKTEQGKTLYQDQVHVPLIIKAPGVSPSQVNALTDSAVDMSATLLDLVGVEPPSDYDGISLVPVLEGRALKEALAGRLLSLRIRGWEGAVLGDYKAIKRGAGSALYNLKKDKKERTNLAEKEPALLRQMTKRMRAELQRSKRVYEAGLKQ